MRWTLMTAIPAGSYIATAAMSTATTLGTTAATMISVLEEAVDAEGGGVMEDEGDGADDVDDDDEPDDGSE